MCRIRQIPLYVVNYVWYLADVYDEEDEDDEDEDLAHDGAPDWVESEREQFKSYRDKDKDGKLNADEVKEWIIPEDYDHSESEAQHLVFTADENKVCVIIVTFIFYL